MTAVQCKKLTCKYNVRSAFYGHGCSKDIIKLSESGRCDSFERDTLNHIKDKKANKILGFHDGLTS